MVICKKSNVYKSNKCEKENYEKTITGLTVDAGCAAHTSPSDKLSSGKATLKCMTCISI